MSTPTDISLMLPPPSLPPSLPPPSPPSPPPPPTPSRVSSRATTFSTEQLLALPVALLNLSCNPVTLRPAHHSSKNNSKFYAILLGSLSHVTDATVQRFKKFVSSLPARFNSTLAFEFKGYCVLSEADVANYLESQAVYAAWQAVLEMVPTVRDYDLMTTRQFSIEDGIPDQVFVKQFRNEDGSTRFEEFAIIEVKAPGYVRGLFHDIEKRKQPGYTFTPNWVAITQQLRKYATNSMAKDIIVMDESAAIYFQFSNEPEDEYNNVEFLTADATRTSPRSPFSLRELVAFVCWRALRRSGVKFPDFAPDGQAVMAQYKPVLDHDTEPGPRKRPHGGDSLNDNAHQKRTRQQTSTGGVGSGSGSLTKFAGWTAGLSFDLCLDPPQFESPSPKISPSSSDDTPPELQLRPPSPHSFDSGCDDLGSSPCIGSERKPRELKQPLPGQTTYHIEHVFVDHVAEVSSPHVPGRWIAKFFAPTPKAQEYLANEISVYNLCRARQGREIPYAYGLAVIPNIPGRVLLTECICPGTPIAEIQEAAERGEVAAKRRLHALAGGAEDVVRVLHRYGVVHNDLYGRNLLVARGQDGEEMVVVVDFDVAMVFYDGMGRKQGEDWAVFRGTFGMDG